MEQIEVGDTLTCINNEPMPGNENGIAPPLEAGATYTVVSIALDSQRNQHLNVGLLSSYNYIRSYETGEDLPDGHNIHWCHPSRFTKN